MNWHFHTNLTEIVAVTPWFSIRLKNGAKEYIRYGISWGFDIEWKRTTTGLEGEYIFERHFRYESDFISAKDLLNDRHLWNGRHNL
jgi:hypothetical protein